jgi:hypothetical protein
VINGTSRSTFEENYAAPASTVLLLQESHFDEVFREGKLPEDSIYRVGTLTTYYSSDSAKYLSYYDFDMAAIFTHCLREEMTDTLTMLLVPVDVTYSSTQNISYLSSVGIKQSVTATKIVSAKSKTTPLDIEILYSGFSNSYIGQ